MSAVADCRPSVIVAAALTTHAGSGLSQPAPVPGDPPRPARNPRGRRCAALPGCPEPPWPTRLVCRWPRFNELVRGAARPAPTDLGRNVPRSSAARVPCDSQSRRRTSFCSALPMESQKPQGQCGGMLPLRDAAVMTVSAVAVRGSSCGTMTTP